MWFWNVSKIAVCLRIEMFHHFLFIWNAVKGKAQNTKLYKALKRCYFWNTVCKGVSSCAVFFIFNLFIFTANINYFITSYAYWNQKRLEPCMVYGLHGSTIY